MRQRDPRARFAPRSPSLTVVATIIIMAIVMIGIPGRVLRTTAVAAIGRADHWLDRLPMHLCAPAVTIGTHRRPQSARHFRR